MINKILKKIALLTLLLTAKNTNTMVINNHNLLPKLFLVVAHPLLISSIKKHDYTETKQEITKWYQYYALLFLIATITAIVSKNPLLTKITLTHQDDSIKEILETYLMATATVEIIAMSKGKKLDIKTIASLLGSAIYIR